MSDSRTTADDFPTSHTLHEPYSASHPVPTVQDFQRREKEAADATAAASSSSPGTDTSSHQFPTSNNQQRAPSPQELQVEEKPSTDLGGNAKEQAKQRRAEQTGKAGRRTVMDPVTGNREVEIEDVGKHVLRRPEDEKVTVPKGNVVGEVGKEGTLEKKETHPSQFPDTNTIPSSRLSNQPAQKTSPTQPLKEYAETQDNTSPPDPIAPHTTTDVPLPAGSKTNLLFHPTPTLSLTAIPVLASLEATAKRVCIAIFILTTFVPFLPSLLGLPLSSHTPKLTTPALFLTSTIGTVTATVVWLWMRNLLTQARNVEWSAEPKRGEIATANLIPESVEWLNTLLGIGWRLVNPEEMLSGVVDMLEDVMQASVPSVVESVRVADMSQGEIPLRILSLRSLPDHHVKELKEGEGKEDRSGSPAEKEQKQAENLGGEWYNLEASVAYHAAPMKDDGGKNKKDKSGQVQEKSKNLHLLVVFRVGVRGVFAIPIPIWVELTSLVVTTRLRLQMIPNPPFLSQLTFTLMGTPQVAASCLPMSKDQRGLNVLDLPFISSFVDSSIKTVAAEYVAPKSMTLDLKKMLEGDDVKKDTETMGVLVVKIHRAEGLSRQDRRGGGADAYVTLGWSKFGKPMYSTRVIVGDLNPVWEETGFLLVKPEHVKAEENLSVELWDSDRFTSDDVVGKVEVPLKSLLLHPGKMHPQTTTQLAGLEHDSHLPGKLIWEVGYFPKLDKFRPALRTTGEDARLGETLQGKPELQDAQGSIDSKVEDGVLFHPPDPLFPQGILSIIVHQCVGLEVKSLKGTFQSHTGGGREWEPGMPDTGELTDEEGGHLPNSYVVLALNDQLVYRTRTKALSSKPIFNAGTERFVPDWRNAQITVCVRDSRLREHDPILGVVPIKLGQLLETRSQVTRWFPLDAGVGFGRIRLSFLWRAVDMRLERPLTGWDVGTVEFTSDYIVAEVTSSTSTKGTLTPGKLRFRTGGSVAGLPKSAAATFENGILRWDVRHPAGQTQPGTKRLRLPVKHRHMSPLIIEFHPSTAGIPILGRKKSKSHPVGHAILWLNTITDTDLHDIVIPIYHIPNPTSVKRLTQNHIDDPVNPDSSHHKGLEGIEVLGQAKFQLKFLPGLAKEHQRFATTNDDRELFETWEACYTEGIRTQDGGDGKVEVSRTVKRLHGESLGELRKDLAEEPKLGGQRGEMESEEERRKRLMDKYGVSWEGIVAAAEREFEANGFRSGYGYNEEEKSGRRDSMFSHGSSPSDASHDPTDDYYDPSSSSESETEPESTSSTTAEATQNPIQPVGADPDPAKDEAGKAAEGRGPLASLKRYRAQQRTLHRRQQGLMQWKPMRTLAFAKDEMGVGVRRLGRKMGAVGGRGREAEVETEV